MYYAHKMCFAFKDIKTEGTVTRVSPTKPTSEKSTVFISLYFTLHVQSTLGLSKTIQLLYIPLCCF